MIVGSIFQIFLIFPKFDNRLKKSYMENSNVGKNPQKLFGNCKKNGFIQKLFHTMGSENIY